MKSPATLAALRARAVAQTLFAPTTLSAALRRLAFVQADPIRAPARAQDLILRHRVEGYRAGDLEARYPSLAIEEDLLYAYGFVTREVWQLLHPRLARRWSALERRVLAHVEAEGAMHPGALEAQFGGRRVVNAWGGYSKATTRALEELHHRGLLRIARRENGIRVYELAPARAVEQSAEERLEALALVVARVLAPVQRRTLQALVGQVARRMMPRAGDAIARLIRAGALSEVVVDGVAYLAPATARAPESEAPMDVRFLAPFDPVVWDRRRFEHLWGWTYRFEAYTPKAKRVRGYYALPLLFGERVIGWANAGEGGQEIELGFVDKRPGGADFARALDAEIARLRQFLSVRKEG